MHYLIISTALAFVLLSSPALAEDAFDARVETNVRAGSERSIYMNEFWIPVAQAGDRVAYVDIRLMGDNKDCSSSGLMRPFKGLA